MRDRTLTTAFLLAGFAIVLAANEAPVAFAEEGKERAGGADAASQAAFEKWRKTVRSDLPAVRVRVVKPAPVIDGKVDEVYRASGTALTFKRMDGSAKKPRFATTAWVVSDDEALYIAIRCESPDPEKVIGGSKTRDKVHWTDEAVEIFIDPRGTRWELYYHIIVNTLGTTRDAREQFDISWDPKLTVKCGKDPGKAWIMEMKLPFKEFGIAKGDLAKAWSLNITRCAHNPAKKGDYEETAWSPVGDDCSHVPEMFGYLHMDAIEEGKRAGEDVRKRNLREKK